MSLQVPHIGKAPGNSSGLCAMSFELYIRISISHCQGPVFFLGFTACPVSDSGNNCLDHRTKEMESRVSGVQMRTRSQAGKETWLEQTLIARFLSLSPSWGLPLPRPEQEPEARIQLYSPWLQSLPEQGGLEGVTGNDLQKNYPGDSNDGLSCIPRDSWKASWVSKGKKKKPHISSPSIPCPTLNISTQE